ncbi:c-type cytochrome [Candidimonas sp. SYP-B2681]|uniref:c-type cytochrome n=1 Tax=Candidimonas sp. SYP-B2681 TaxID=2497686 RepID=UPI000F89B002|nr:c-type cytochrome [Candidimonas sp. SYP-B2681]RTZ40015.1 c-type cytochrome [Candidimonas sp. SYP-B2681]
MKVLPSLSPSDYADWDKRHAPVSARSPEFPATAPMVDQPLGDIAAGRQALQQYLCTTCHVIPGIVGANSHIGPSLSGIADRQYIAGVLPNTPANMVQWIQKPSAIAPLSAMPDLGVTEKDARDMAAFFYTLGKKE